jgi:cysteine-rich repeat protein
MKILSYAAVLLALCCFSTAALAQDDCATAVAVPGGVDPCLDSTPTGPLGPCTSGGSLNDMWLTFVATDTTARVRTDVSSLGTDSDYKVYSGTCAGGLTEIGCSEDDAAPPNVYLGDICVGGLVPGNTYYIRLGAWASETGAPPGYQFSCGVYNVDIEAATGAICGDGTISCVPGQEECDDGNALPGDGCENCLVVAVCGNGVREAGEQCDGAALSACPGACNPDCTCNFPGIPAVSEWGLVVLVLIGLAVGTIMFGRRREVNA